MIRNRFPRFRNLQNLHVIPTASSIPLSNKETPAESELPAVTVLPHISDNNTEQKMFNQNEPQNQFNKTRKIRNKRKTHGKYFPASRTEIPRSSYHWYSPSYINQSVYSYPLPEKVEEVESTPEVPIEEDFEEVEVASVDADGKQEILVGFRASKLHYLNYKKNCFFKPKIYKFGSQRTFVNCLNVQDNCSVDIDVVSEAEYEVEYENDNLDQSESQDQEIKNTKVNKKTIKSKKCNESDQKENSQLEKNQVLEVNDVDESSRIYKTCIEENADINQGQCLVQNCLDTWKSHLIGLEYLIEIRDKSKAKYYCVLCSEELQVEVFPAINVINHISGYKHIVKYLEKHFPSYGFQFHENSDYNVVALQKICEEINEKMGFFFMCITNLDCYKKNEQKMKNIIHNASHINEKNLKLEKNAFQKTDETLKNIKDVVDGIIEEIVASEENTVVSKCDVIERFPFKLGNEVNHSATSELQTYSLDKTYKPSMHGESTSKNNLKSFKSFLKYKGNSALSSYLKIKYARAKSKGLKPLKGLSRLTKRLSTESTEYSEKKHTDHEPSKSESTKSGEIVSGPINSSTSKKVLGNKEKVLQKPTVHSKHCRKRILGREITRLKVAAKPSTKDEFISGVLKKSKVKSVSVSESGNQSSSKRTDKGSKSNETTAAFPHNSSSVQKIISVPTQKISKQDSRSPFTSYSKNSHHRIVHKKEIESSKHEIDMMMTRNSSSHWKAITRTSGSPMKSSDNSPFVLKSETRKHSVSPLRRSPVKRTVRRQSKSPVKMIKSPLRLVHRSPVRKFSRSPVRRHSRSPFRRKSRSPHWKHSRPPFKKKSRSPMRRLSRSPVRRRSRSPLKRHSRSPFRRHSRSPLRRYSRSPVRRRTRSPVRRRSRSPVRRRSRSPWRRCSRSPVRRHSRSPIKRHSRSPIKRHRSPVRKHPRSSVGVSESPAEKFRSMYKVGLIGSDQDRISNERFSQKVYNYDKHLGQHDREFTKVRSSKNFHSFVNNTSDKRKPPTFVPGIMRGISDLDPVSDEDESIYFDKQQRVEDSVTSSSKMMLAQLLQKFSVSNVNPDDPSLNKLMLFMEAHSAEIQELMGSQSASKVGKLNPSKVDSSVQERSLYLQQYLLSNLAGSSQEPGLSSVNLNVQPKYQQPPFLSESDNVGRGLVPNVVPHNHPQSNLPRFFPPNVNVPPPEPYRPFNQPHQEFSPKSQVPPEVMFKDLKATVSKLFGANEGAVNQEKNKSLMPGYVTVPDPEKWDLSHPDTPKFNAPTKFSGHMGPRFNAPVSQKNVFHSQGKSDSFSGVPESSAMRADMPMMYNNNNNNSNNNAPGQFFSGRGIDRPQGPNVAIPPPDAKVSFCDVPRGSSKGNLFPVVHSVNTNFSSPNSHGGISDVKVSLAQRLASVLVKVGMTDVPAPLLQEMLMKIGAFSSLPRQDISEAEIISILKRLGYLS